IRTLASRLEPAPRPASSSRPAPSSKDEIPSLASEVDEDDATNVMMPRAAPPPGLFQAATAARQVPATKRSGDVPAPKRLERPDVDLIPKTQRIGAERTVVMPNAPQRTFAKGAATLRSGRALGSEPPPARQRAGATLPPNTRSAPPGAIASTPPPEDASAPRQ